MRLLWVMAATLWVATTGVLSNSAEAKSLHYKEDSPKSYYVHNQSSGQKHRKHRHRHDRHYRHDRRYHRHHRHHHRHHRHHHRHHRHHHRHHGYQRHTYRHGHGHSHRHYRGIHCPLHPLITGIAIGAVIADW